MINCVICDDDAAIAEQAKAITEAVFHNNDCGVRITTYTSAVLLLSDILEYKPVDLAILDIEMPHYTGMQLAEEIKHRFPDCCIIFLTSHIKYAVESYELQIFRYTPKSDIETKLPIYIADAIHLLRLQKAQTYTILKNNHLEQLPYKQILCIEKDGKYAVITCVDNREIRVRKPLGQVLDELDETEFALVDRGCVVNIALISRIGDHEVICRNGARFSISRSRLKETKVQIADYWGGKI